MICKDFQICSKISISKRSKANKFVMEADFFQAILDTTCTWKFPSISYFSDLIQTSCARKIPEPVLETTLNTKEATYMDFRKYFLYLFGK
jgi:hypothetical protein